MKYHLTPQGRGLGWLPDLPDKRDRIFAAPAKVAAVAAGEPQAVDLRAECAAVYDQGQLGSCTANALAAAYDFDRHKQGKAFMGPSRLFIYWNEREVEGTVDSDAGAMIRDGVKVLKDIGTADEDVWPYDIAKFRDKPSAVAFTEAKANETLTYERIVTPHDTPTSDMLACLSMGYPFVTGISVYESFETDETKRTGIIPLPEDDEELLGGHAVLVVGYDQAKQWFTCRNSWGPGWGDHGYFYLPYDYLISPGLASDMWVIRTVEV